LGAIAGIGIFEKMAILTKNTKQTFAYIYKLRVIIKTKT